MRVMQFKRGSTVVVQNSVNKGFFYLVKSGQLSVDSEHRMQDRVLSQFEPGDTFGLVSALTGHKYLVSVFADVDSTVIEIPIKMLGSYLKERRHIAIKMLSRYSRELRAIHKYLSKANNPDDRLYHPDKLLSDAERYIKQGQRNLASHALVKYIEWGRQQSGKEQRIEVARKMLKDSSLPETLPVWENNTRNVEAGEVLFLENEISKEIYVIKSGGVRIFTHLAGQELVINILEDGEIFGEMAFIDETVRMASAVAEQDSSIMRFTKDTLFDSFGEVILQKMFENLARRIWFSHQRLVILKLKDPVSRIYAFLYNMIRDYDIRKRLSTDMTRSYEFLLKFEDVKKMCGVAKLSDEKFEFVFKDSNLEINADNIVIGSRKRIEEHVSYYRTNAGQISSASTK